LESLKLKKVTKKHWSRNILAKIENKMECYQYSSLMKNFPKMKIVLAKWASDQWIILSQCFSHSHWQVGKCYNFQHCSGSNMIYFWSDVISTTYRMLCHAGYIPCWVLRKKLTLLRKQSLSTEVKWLSVVTWHTSYFHDCIFCDDQNFQSTSIYNIIETQRMKNWTKLVTHSTL